MFLGRFKKQPCSLDIVTERTDSQMGIRETEFIADEYSQEQTRQTTGCRHADDEAVDPPEHRPNPWRGAGS